MREWEVIAVRDLERATAEAGESAVALIDLGETDAGIDMANKLYHNGITIPCVVVGDKPVDDGRASVLVRPFSLEDLGTAVREAAARPTLAPAPASRVEEAEPEVRLAVGNGSAVEAPPLRRPPIPAPKPVVEPAPEPVEESPPIETSAPLETVEVEAPEPALEPEPVSAPAPVVEVPEPAWEPAPEPEPSHQPEPAWEPAPEPVAQTTTPPAPVWERPADHEATRPVFHETHPGQPPPTATPAKTGWKRRLRTGGRPQHAVQPEAEAPIVRRLKVAAAHALELEDLIGQMPFLADLHAMAAGLVGEIDRQFVCAIASVTVRRQEGFAVVAHRGLSKVESGMVILESQPLFSDVLKTRDGVLIQPVDLAQGLVAGIGGSRTEAMMVAPALVNDEIVAIVVVGGEQFTELDLDRLSELAAEAAPGLAVALLLDRLRNYY